MQKNNKNFQDKAGVKGHFRAYKTKGEPLTEDELEKIRNGEDIEREYEKVYETDNLIVEDGRERIIDALVQNQSAIAEIEINKQELGTDSTAPADGDTGLGSPDAGTRKNVHSIAKDDSNLDQANVTMAWTSSELSNGTNYKEAGLFINGTGTSNSGVLYNRFNIDVTTNAGDALTLDGTITIS